MLRNIVIAYALLNVSFITEVNMARILGVFQVPSISHQVVFRPLTQELARRGHEIVIITPNPAFSQDKRPDNITEIDVGATYTDYSKMMDAVQKYTKRGVILDIDYTASRGANIGHELFIEMFMGHFDNPEIKKLIENKTQHFDLIIADSYLDYPLIYTHIFQAPAILFSSFYGFTENFETIGAVSRHPVLYPNYQRNKYSKLTFWEKVWELYIEYKLWHLYHEVEEIENSAMKAHFGPNTPTIKELKNNVAMLFLNAHPLFSNNRPVPPSVLYLGAFHMQPVKELPLDLKKYLDNSKRGVVYVSLGTNVRIANMDKEFLNVFLKAFEALPYDILWKFDFGEKDIEKLPKHIRVEKWFPQRDLLVHPNVKAFVTQGGMQSTDEAIDGGVPLVGLPMLGDQWYNVNKYEQLGIGIALDAVTVTTEELVKAVKKVVDDTSYKINIEHIRAVLKERPQPALDAAVWWAEHVIRYKGASHLRSPAANMLWRDYFMMDVVAPFAVIVLAIVSLGILMLYLSVKVVIRMSKKYYKVKQS